VFSKRDAYTLASEVLALLHETPRYLLPSIQFPQKIKAPLAQIPAKPKQHATGCLKFEDPIALRHDFSVALPIFKNSYNTL
jgi:hypothetical protein